MGLSNVFRSKIFSVELLVGNFFFRVYQQLFVFLVLDMDLSGTRAHGCFENALILRFQHPEHANQAIQLYNGYDLWGKRLKAAFTRSGSSQHNRSWCLQVDTI